MPGLGPSFARMTATTADAECTVALDLQHAPCRRMRTEHRHSQLRRVAKRGPFRDLMQT